jgi:predicted small lipoprotein YifL
MRMPFLILVLATLVTACGKKEPYTLPDVEGKSEAFIEQKYGKSEYDYSFHLSDTLLEYRYGLLSKFPETKDHIMIKEKKFTDEKLTIFIWFYEKNGQWIVATSLAVPDGVKI